MTLTIQLPDELEAELSARAARENLALQDYIVRVLSGPESASKQPMTGAEIVSYWKREHLLGVDQEVDDVPSHARALRARAERRTLE